MKQKGDREDWIPSGPFCVWTADAATRRMSLDVLWLVGFAGFVVPAFAGFAGAFVEFADDFPACFFSFGFEAPGAFARFIGQRLRVAIDAFALDVSLLLGLTGAGENGDYRYCHGQHP